MFIWNYAFCGDINLILDITVPSLPNITTVTPNNTTTTTTTIIIVIMGSSSIRVIQREVEGGSVRELLGGFVMHSCGLLFRRITAQTHVPAIDTDLGPPGAACRVWVDSWRKKARKRTRTVEVTIVVIERDEGTEKDQGLSVRQ